jgi:DHA1 family bicyclomycin/chloramphenicol resistance-like MFS transporter
VVAPVRERHAAPAAAGAPRRFVWLLPVLVALQAISTDLYLPALPAISRALAADVTQVQLTLSLFLVAFAIAQLAYGPLSDRFGRRPLLLAGTALYVAASLACMAAPTVEALILFRVLQAVGACCGPVLGRAVVRDVYEPADAARVLAYVATAMALAPALGPILGGWLTEAFGWRATFAALALFGTAALVGILAVLPETNRRPDPTATRPAVLVRNYAELLRERSYLARVAVAAAAYGGIFTFISGSSFVLIDTVGLSPSAYGLAFAVGILGWAGGTFAAGRLGRRLGLAGLLRIGVGLVLTAGTGGLALALTTGLSLAGVVLPMIVYMAGAGFLLPTAMALAIGPYPTRAGLASALLGFLQLSAAAAVGVLLSVAYDGTAVPMMATLVALGLLAALARRAARP